MKKKDIFSSISTQRSLRTIANLVLKLSKTTARIQRLIVQPGTLASTDGSNIFYDPDQTKELATSLAARYTLLRGLIVHEAAHVIYTNFVEFRNFTTEDLCQETLDSLPWSREVWFQDFTNNLPTNKVGLTLLVFRTFNMFEDGFIELNICSEFEGQNFRFIKDLEFTRSKIEDSSPTLDDILDRLHEGEITPWDFTADVLFRYATYKDFAVSKEVMRSDPYKAASAALPLVDKFFEFSSTTDRLYIAFSVVAMFKDQIIDLLDKMEEDQITRNYRLCNSDEAGSKQFIPAKRQKGSDSSHGTTSASTGTDTTQEDETGDESLDDIQEEETQSDVEAEASIPSESDSREENEQKEQEDLLKHLLERQEQEELEIGKTDYGIASAGLHQRATLTEIDFRKSELSASQAAELVNIEKTVRKLVTNVTRNVLARLKTESTSDIQTGLFWGTNLTTSELYRKDNRIFNRKRMSDIELDLAIAVLVDQSGSMNGDKIEISKLMALTLHGVCTSLNVPFAIWGHQEKVSFNTTISLYANFDKKTNWNPIMHMNANGNNRDGFALTYALNQLSTRHEQKKILFYVNDGQPAADGGYCGDLAGAELQQIAKNFRSQGIQLIVCGIDDQEALKPIYGKAFLNIKNLNNLPKLLASKVLEQI